MWPEKYTRRSCHRVTRNCSVVCMGWTVIDVEQQRQSAISSEQ